MDIFTRRNFFSKSIKLAPLFATPGLMAEQLTLTPPQTPGPFFPDKLPLDTDNDLVIINDSLTPSVGAITYLGGKVTDAKGNPLRHATVELWQVDGKGVYLHSGGGQQGKNGSQLPRIREIYDGFQGTVFLPYDQATPVSGQNPSFPYGGFGKGEEKVHHPVLHQGRAPKSTGLHLE